MIKTIFSINDYKYKPLLAAAIFALSGFLFIQTASAEGLPGTVEGVGSHFVITNSSYLNVTLDSSEMINLRMESVPEMVTLFIESSSSAIATQVIFTGFNPNTTYYKYEDNYHNLTAFIADSSGYYSYTQDLSQPHLVFIQPRTSTKFIKDDITGGDCSSIGIWDFFTKTCVLTQNLFETVQVDSNSVTLNGNGNTITGNGTGNGVYLPSITGATIKNLKIQNFPFGILLYQSSNNTLTGNTLNSNNFATHLLESSNNTLTGNIASNNVSGGIFLSNSSDNILIGNTASSSGSTGIGLNSSTGNTLTGNTADLNGFVGISIAFSSNNTLTGNIVQENGNNFDNYDVKVFASSDIDCNNSITNTTGSGGRPIKYFSSAVNLSSETLSELILCNADHSNISDIVIDGSSTRQNNGLLLVRTDSSTITSVNSSNNFIGIQLDFSNGNTLTGNTVNSNNFGAFLGNSSGNNTLTNNTASNNTNTGIYIGSPSSNSNQIYRNNLIDNSTQAIVETPGNSGNIFNLPLSDGGNYWSDYDTPAEGCIDTDADNFCDSPYTFSGGQDNLPWIVKDGWAGPPKMVKPTVGGEITQLQSGRHSGIDIDSDIDGTPIFATATGTVFHVATSDSDCGDWVWIFHDDIKKLDDTVVSNISTTYLHLTNVIVGIGDTVSRGQQIGLGDNTGIGSTAPHLHFGVRQGPQPTVAGCEASDRIGDSTVALDPLDFVSYDLDPKYFEVKVESPVDLIVTDPDGLVVSKQSNDLPGEARYFEAKYLSDFSNTEPSFEEGVSSYDVVQIDIRKDGDYTIAVIPESGASPTDTYTLSVNTTNSSITLAEHVQVSAIPGQPYIIRSNGLDAEEVIPAIVNAQPETLNISQEGDITVFVSFSNSLGVSISDIDPSSITVGGAFAERTAVAIGAGKFIAHFNTQDITGIEPGDIVEFKVIGSFQDGTSFEGSDTITVIE